MSKEKRSYRLLRITGIVIGSILLLLAGLRLSLKTDFVRGIAQNVIVSSVNDALNGTLSIASIEGDLWNELTVTEISLSMDEQNILTADTLSVSYRIMDLLGSVITVQSVEFRGAQVSLKEREGSFRVENLLRQTDESADSTDNGLMISVNSIAVSDAGIQINSPSHLPDSTLSIEKIGLQASLHFAEHMQFTLETLEFRLREGRLPEPLDISLSGGLENEVITLEQLVARTGRSLLEANARFGLADSTINAGAQFRPLALKDVAPYIDQDLNDLKITIEGSVKGAPRSIDLRIEADHPLARELDITAGLALEDEPILTKLSIQATSLDLIMISDSLPRIQSGAFEFSMKGKFRPQWDLSDGNWSGWIMDIKAMNRRLQSLSLEGSIGSKKVTTQIRAVDADSGEVKAAIVMTDPASPDADWELAVHAKEIDLSNWSENTTSGTINGWIGLQGSGFSLSGQPWSYQLTTSPEPDDSWSRFRDTFPDVFDSQPGVLTVNGQPIDAITMNGTLTAALWDADIRIGLGRSRTEAELILEDPTSSRPKFQFDVQTTEFNVADIEQFAGFPTYLNLSIAGNGSGNTMEDLQLYTELNADSSIVNGASLSEVEAVLSLENGILSITRGVLNSEITDILFSGRRNLVNQDDPENRLSVDLTLKYVQPLAPLFEAEDLNATGSMKGDITQNKEGALAGKFDLDLKEIRIDSMFTAAGITGLAELAFDEGVRFKTQTELRSPVINGILLQDVQLNADGEADTDSVSTEFSLNVKGSTEGRFTQQGSISYHLQSGNADLYLTGMEILTDESSLILRKDFTLSRNDDVFRTDTLFLSDEMDSTYLKLSIPYADSVRQEGWLEGRSFDFGLTQDVLLGERFMDGVLSGDLTFSRDRDNVNSTSAIRLDQISINGVAFDSLTIRNTVDDRRLKGQAAAWWAGERHLFADITIPFALFSEDLNDAFFDSPVEGTMDISDVDLSRFENLMLSMGYPRLIGMFNLNATISGSAAEPVLSGGLNWSEPVISGINLDQISADFDFDSDKSEVLFSGEVQAAGQQAASLNAEIPLDFNFRTLKLKTPGENDTLALDLRTQEFNLAVFNGFLDPLYTKNLKGSVDAELKLNGTPGSLMPEGFMNLSSASLEVPVAGITLGDVRSRLQFSDDGLQVKEFYMASGPGRLTANGSISMNGLSPDSLNLNARARQFQLANTEQYKLLADLDGGLSGSLLKPRLSGTFNVLNGFVYLDDFGQDKLETVYLEDEQEPTVSLYDSLAIDMQVVIERNFFVRNEQYLDLEIELAGELDAAKDAGEDLSLFGNLEGRDGYVSPLNKLFTLEEANMTFTGPIDNPEIFVRSKHIPPTRQKGESVILFYIIEGAAQDPEFRFDSEPYMEEQDIVCYTLFGKPCYSLESWQSVFADGGGTSARDVLTDVLLDEVESLATRNLGVDLVQIDNTGTAGGTSITTGWYINERTFFAIINEITSSTPRTMFMLEYVLSETWDLILMQGDSNQRGIDFRYEYDY